MPRLVTQAVTDMPIVVLVGSDSPLLLQLAAFFKRHEFSVEQHSLTTASKIVDTKSYKDKQLYKVLFVDGWSPKQTQLNVEQIVAAIRFFSELTDQTYLIQECIPVTETDEHYAQKQLRYQVETTIPSTHIILGQDVLLSPTSWWWWKAVSAKIDQHILLHEDQAVYPISSQLFLKLVQLALLKPARQQRLLIRGKKQESSVVLAEVSRQVELIYQKKLVVQAKTNATSKQEVVPDYFIEQEVVIEPLPTLLQELVQSVSLSENKNKDRSETTQQSPIVPPTPPSNLLSATPPIPRVIQPPIAKQVTPVDKPKTTQESIDDKVSKLFSEQRIENKVGLVQQKVATNKKITAKNNKRGKLFIGGLIAAGAGSAILLLAVFFIVSQTVLRLLLVQQMAKPNDKILGLGVAQSVVQVQTEAYELVAPAPFFDTAHEWLALTTEWQTANQLLAETKEKQIQQFQQLIGNSDQVKVAQLDQAGYESLSRLSSRLTSELEQTSSPTKEQQVFKEYLAYLELQRSAVIAGQQLSPLWPELLAHTTKRTYAVLFQNEQELRASGGFLQAVALVTLDNGQIIDTQVFSVYELDNKLSAVVAPPEDLKQVLGEERWYLRDSNWNPDFPTTAGQISWFLQQLLNKKVDGVIAVNVGVVQDILRATGPLDLPEYNELLTDRNLAERMEFHSEVSLVESSQVNDYSVTLLTRLLEKIQNTTPEKTGDFLSVISQQLKEKNIVISLSDKNEEATFSLLGWTGELIKPNCPAQFSSNGCEVDTFGTVDTNAGVNKANYHVSRKDSHRVSLSPTLATHTHTITFTNTAQSNSWPKGEYRSYLRFVLPSSAKLKSISVDGEQLFAKDIIISQQSGFSLVGFISNTAIKSSSVIELVYSTPVKIESGDAYTLFFQKQPGIEQPLQSITINLDPTLSPSLLAPQADVSENIISFPEINPGHMFIGVALK